MKAIQLFLILSILSACTGNFRNMNTDHTGITDEEMKADYNDIGIPLKIVQEGIYFNYDFGKGKNWPYQLMQNLSADMFSGYMHDCKPLNGGSHNSDYNLQDGWNSTMWENTYAYILPQIKKMENVTYQQYPQFYAITKILKVMLMHRVADYYGPIIYKQFGNEKMIYTPDSQQDAYYYFFEDLDHAIERLENFLALHPETPGFSQFDLLLNGQYATWIKFANSLRLRIAVRLSTADPQKGSLEAQKALTNAYGVFEKPGEIVAVRTDQGYTNPLGEINRSWNEVFMNANMESILNGYQDPRREVFFEPCPHDITIGQTTIPLQGKYKGIRQGTLFAHTNYASHSRITVNTSTPAILMTAAEIWFLRAEAALRGWTDENTGDCYRKGIRTSFAQWGVWSDSYDTSDAMPTDYTDVFNPEYNIQACCQVSPKWEETATPEVKLEKIITQKWLALFPEGCEAWTEQRRTGYPRLFPVKYNNSPAHCIDTDIMIRRLGFPGKLKDSDEQLYNSLCLLLQGPDHAGTRLWWDTGKKF